MTIRALGGWVHVRVLPPEDPRGIQTMLSGQYVSDGICAQRLGYARATILSIGDSFLEKYGPRVREVRTPPELVPGAVVWFRGFLSELTRVSRDEGGCFIQQNAIVLTETLDSGPGGVL